MAEPAPTMGVSGFASRIASVGLASPNKFEVEFSGGVINAVRGDMDIQTLNIMCESVTLAGRTVQSILDRQYGVNREVAYNGPTYTPITLSFLCSSNYAEKKLFDRWNDKIVSIKNAWDVEYYNNYTGLMTVKTLDRDGVTVTHTQIYHECYPKTVAAIELNHSTQNSAVRLTVEMQYAFWETLDLKLNDTRTTGATLQGQNLTAGQLG
jgi:hypothetical protein